MRTSTQRATSLEDKLVKVKDQIEKKTAELKELKKQEKEIQSKINSNRIKELSKMIKDNDISMEELQEFVEKKKK